MFEAFPLGGEAGVGDSFAVGKRYEETTFLVTGSCQVRDDFVTSGQIGHSVTVDEGDETPLLRQNVPITMTALQSRQ